MSTQGSQATGRSSGSRSRRFSLGRWVLLLGAAVLAAGVLLGLAPALVAHTPLGRWLLAAATRQFDGQVTVGAASLGWFSPVVLRDVEARGADGQRLLELAVVRSDQPLWALARNPRRVGLLHVERPQLRVVVRDGGSNVEDAVQSLARGGPSEGGLELRVEVSGGTVEIADGQSSRSWRVNDVGGTFVWGGGASKETTLRIEGRVPLADGGAGRLATELIWPDSSGADAAARRLDLHCEALPLPLVQLALRRARYELKLSGRVSGDFGLAWTPGGAIRLVSIRGLSVEDFSLAAPQWLGSDKPSFRRLLIDGRIQWSADRVAFRGVRFDSDWGRLHLDGSAPLPRLASRPISAAAAALQHGDYELEGNIDLAEAARMFPATLRLHQGIRITSGQVALTLAARGEGDQRRWQGQLSSTPLAAVRGGRKITWDRPIRLDVSARQSPAGLVIEQLACDADFLQLSARGELSRGALSIVADLGELADAAGRFVDLGQLRLTGKLDGQCQWRRGPEQGLVADGQVSVVGLEIAGAGWRPWCEELLTLSFAAGAQTDGRRWRRLDHAAIRFASGTDYCDIQLREPLEAPSWDATWPLTVRLRGDLAAWAARLQSPAASPLQGVEGAVDLNTSADIGPHRIELSRVACEFAPLRWHGSGLSIDEQRVVVEGSCRWDGLQRSLTAKTATLASSTLAFRGEDIVWSAGESPGVPIGRFAFRADLARLLSWFRDPNSPPAAQCSGMATGNIRLDREAGVTRVDGSAQVKDFVLLRPAAPSGKRPAARPVLATSGAGGDLQTVWREKQVALAGRGSFDSQRKTLVLESLHISSDGDSLSLQMQGAIVDPAGRRDVDLTGRMEYDLERLLEKLRPYAGSQLKLVGRDTRPFSLRGPLAASDRASGLAGELKAEAGLGWTSASLPGITMGPGELHVRVADGVLAADPLDLAVNEGRLHIRPRIELNASPATLVLAPGLLAERIRITPAVCRTWLKYVAPLVAEATRAEGQVSITLEAAAVPIAAPETGRVRGRLIVHEAQVGPGPLSQEFLGIAQQVKAIVERRPPSLQHSGGWDQWVFLPSQEIPFELTDGRVVHRGLEIHVQDVVIRTSGSVGLDQSLDLTAEVPIQDEWVQSDRVLSSLRGQVVRIPIRGTLSRPKLERRGIEQLAAQMLNRAAAGLFQEQLQRGLQQLFGPPK